MFPENHTLIGTLRIQGAKGSTPALRLSISGMLNSADLRPGGMAPSAILIIRTLADPLPAHLKLHGVAVDSEWERAARDALTRMYHTAARPVYGHIPSDAKAVLFADEGELLACLALDVSRGEAAGRWWWKQIMKRYPSAGLQNLLCRKADCIPAMLHHLTAWGQALTVVSALSPEEVVSVITAVNRVYGLQEPERERTGASPILRSSRAQKVEPPWKKWLVSAPAQLSKEREYLLGLALSLYHEPASVKTHAFLQDLRTWLVHRDSISAVRYHSSEDRPSAIRMSRTGHKDATITKTEQETASEETHDRAGPPSSAIRMTETEHIEAAITKTEQETASEGTGDRAGDPSTAIRMTGNDRREAAIRKTELKQAEVPPRRSAAKEKEPDTSSRPASLQPDEVDEPWYQDTAGYNPDNGSERLAESGKPIGTGTKTCLPGKVAAGLEQQLQLRPGSAGTPPEEGIFTRLGGVLYLINLMRHLDLPACFEEEWGLASQLGSWGVLEVLARVLLGDGGLSHDLLWNVLAELGGRDPGELPGESFSGSERFHLPASWCDSDDLTCYWGADRQRLRLWSEDYMLVDCPGDESAPLMQAKNELDRYLDNNELIELSGRPFDDAPVETSTAPAGLNPELARWLSAVMPYIRLRLRNALGPDTSEDPEREILHVQGRLYVTSTHVDLVMSMNDISISVRLAGLDRDPGWLADFGRVVQFHFE